MLGVPCETVTDWVSYADHVAYIDVTAERELPFEQLEGDPEGNGYIPREVTAAVDDVLWTRYGAPRLPAEIVWDAEGWAVDDGERITVVFGLRVEVGERYLAVLARFPDAGAPIWYPVAADTPPDPVAVRYFDLDPIARYEAVVQQTEG